MEVAMQVRGVDLGVRESGRGVPFFWGHGLMGSVAQEDIADLLDWEEIGHVARALRYDARGHGTSEATLDPADYAWPELAGDLLALASALGAERAVLGGVSMGCATALHAAVAAPDRVEGLVLAAPPTAWDTRPRQARIYRGLAAVIDRIGLFPFRCAASLSRLVPGPAYLAKLQASVVETLSRADRRRVVAALRGAAVSDLPPPDALGSIRAPALILAWHGDRSHPLSTARRLAEILPQADLREAASLDEVLGWTASIRDFLSKLNSTGVPPRA
jgi:pimeloyl-ACP methyl ester carboxylesterase